MDIVKVLIELSLSFIIIYLIYYFVAIRKCKKNKKLIPMEVSIILSFYHIDPKKINLYQMIKVVSVVTSLIIAIIITLIDSFFDSTIIILVFGTIGSILVAIICYQIIGRYYERKSNNEKNNDKNS